MNRPGKNLILLINNIPLRLKMILIYLTIIILPLILVYGLFFVKLRDEVELREATIVDQTLERVVSDINYLFSATTSISRDIAVDQAINELMCTSYDSQAQYFDVYFDKLKDQIQMYATSYNNVIKVSVFTDNPTVLSGGNVYFLNETALRSPWYANVNKSRRKEDVVAWSSPNPLNKGKFEHKISVVRIMDEFAQYNKTMVVRIDIEESRLRELLKKTYDMDFFLIDANDDIIASSLEEYTNDDAYYLTFEPEKFDKNYTLVQQNFYPSDDLAWRVAAIVPKQSLTDVINGYGGLLAVVSTLILVVSVLFIMIFSRSYNDRITILEKHMKRVENSHFDIIEGEYGTDEIGGLIGAFNRMTLRINGLVNEVFRFKLREKDHQLEQIKAELKFLQSQMDPHYLFNTLNAILVVSSRNGYQEITQVIRNLAKTLRYLIEWDDSMVPLEKELTFTRMYLEIEKFRFRDKFEFEIFIEGNLEKVLVPKLMVQPFVENACKHGIQASKNNGKLIIRIYALNDYVHILVEDNGIGMTKEKLTEVLNQNVDSHIGIQNVLKRLAIHYHGRQQFEISSEVNTGTKILIRIPYLDEVSEV